MRPLSLTPRASRSTSPSSQVSFARSHVIGVLDADLGQLLELPCAVTDLLSRHTEEIQERELQVCQRCVLRIDEMTAAFERAAAAADEQRGERPVRMAIAVADGGAIQNDHVVQQRSVA